MIRSFIGLPVQGDALRKVLGLQRPIAGARKVPEENMHLTLAFLGDQPEAQLRTLAYELESLAGDPIPVTLKAPDLLGGKNPRGVVLAAEKSDALVAFQSRIERLLSELDFEFERRRFKPHVTLYRLPNTLPPETPGAIQAWLDARAGIAPIRFNATQMWLYSSRLTDNGAIYAPLAEFTLGAA